MQLNIMFKKVVVSASIALILWAGVAIFAIDHSEAAQLPVAKQVATGQAAFKDPIILVYHSVEPKNNKRETKMQKHYHIYPEKFRSQMQYLKDNGYVPIPMKMYLRYLTHGGEIPNKSVVITFDDGWKNQYEYAFPILKEFGYTATFYIVSGAVGTHSYVTWDQIREMRDAGMDIQSHTKTHANLAKISPEKALAELKESRALIESKIDRSVTMVAYPYYGNNDAVQKLVAEAGYTSARAGWTRTKNSKDVMFTLKSQEAVNASNPFASVPDSN